MKPLNSRIVLLVSFLVAFVSAGLSNKELGQLVKENNYKILPLTDFNYESILKGKRDYHLVVLVSSESPQFNCILCRELKPEYEVVGNSWYKDHPNGLVQADFEDEEQFQQKKNIYFLYSEFMDARKYFQDLKITNIPKVFYYAPTTSNSPVTQYEEYSFITPEHREGLVKWLTDLTGYRYNLYVPFNYSKFFFNVGSVALVVFLLVRFRGFVSSLIGSKFLWKSISLFLVLIFISGYMYNQIRGTPFLIEGPQGKSYISPSIQNQVGIETQIVSFIYGGLSLLFVVLVTALPTIKSSEVRLGAVVIISGLVYFLYSIFLLIFGLKAGGYPYKLLSI